MAEGAYLTDDLRMDTRLANREIVPSHPGGPSPVAEAVKGAEEGLNAYDRNQAWEEGQAAKQRAMDINKAQDLGARAGSDVSIFTPNTSYQTPLNGAENLVPSDVQALLDRAQPLRAAVAQGRAPQAVLEATAQNARAALAAHVNGPYYDQALQAFTQAFGDTAAGAQLKAEREAQASALKTTADKTAEYDAEADHMALLHGHDPASPDFRAQGYTILAAQQALKESDASIANAKAQMEVGKLSREETDATIKSADQKKGAAYAAVGNGVYDSHFTRLQQALQSLPDDDARSTWVGTHIGEISTVVNSIAQQREDALIKAGVTDKDTLQEPMSWAKDIIDSWTKTAQSSVEISLKVDELAAKQSGKAVADITPMTTALKSLLGPAGALKLLTDPTHPLGQQANDLFNKEVGQLVSQYQSGDVTGALGTLVTIQQLKDGTLNMDDLNPQQVAQQNAIAQANLPGAAAEVNQGKGDPSVLLHLNAAANYAAMHTASAPGVSLSLLDQSSRVLLLRPNIQALMNVATNSPDQATRDMAGHTIGATRRAASTIYTSALTNTGANDDMKDNPTGAWKVGVSADGMYYRAYFDRATYDAWAKANPDKTRPASVTINPRAGGMMEGGMVLTNPGMVTVENESRTMPKSVQMKQDSINRALQVLENPSFAKLDPIQGGNYSSKQLADFYIRGKPLPDNGSGVSAGAAQTASLAAIDKDLQTADVAKEYGTAADAADKSAREAIKTSKGEAKLGPIADQAAQAEGIPHPAMFRALIGSESSWDPTLDMSRLSDAEVQKVWAAQGLHFKPGTKHSAKGIAMFTDTTGAEFGLHGEDALDPAKALPAGARKFAQHLREVTPEGHQPDLDDYMNAAARYKGEKHLDSQTAKRFEDAWES